MQVLNPPLGGVDADLRVYKLPDMLSNKTNVTFTYAMNFRLGWFLLDKMKYALDFVGDIGDDIDNVCTYPRP
jgi:hypothetical protein